MLGFCEVLRDETSIGPRWRKSVVVTWSLLLFVGVIGCGGDDAESGGDLGDGSSASAGTPETVEESVVGKLLDQAVSRVKSGDSKGAVELLSQVIGNDPDNARAYAIRADIYAGAKQDANALADFSAAIRIEPKNVRWLNARGFFLFTRGKRDAALRDLNAAIELDASYAEAHNNRGLLHVGTQDYQKAIADFGQAIATDPKFTDAWNNRGFAHFRSNEPVKALSDFDQALACDPKFVMAYNNRALLRMARKEYRQAVMDCSSAIELNGDNPRFFQLRREAYRRLGKSKEALADGEKLIWLIRYQQLSRRVATAPKLADGYIQRARHLAVDGRSGAALADYQRAIAVEPGQANEAYLARARHWIAAGDWKRATADCSRALKIGGDYEAWSLRGEIHMHQGNWDLAIADFTKARRFDKVVAEAYNKRAAAHRAAGRTAEASADRKRAAELDPERFGKSP